ncbi:MAG TPA: ABC transporter permease [Fimbriimonas sp.]|nr:ABC transporter permease [Fimbriimonas sp.]
MIDELKELWRFRELLIAMVQRELRVRYKNSFFGFLWSLANPIATTIVMWLVFSKFMDNGVKSYSAYLLAAYLPYLFLQQSILDSAQSVLMALPVVRKTYFPRELLPLTSVIANFIHLLLGFVVFFVFLLIVYIKDPQEFPLQGGVIYLPFLLLVTLVLATGLSLYVSALNTFYEDVKYLVTVGMYLMFFICPVMYFVEQVANSSVNHQGKGFWVFKLYNLNPIATLCIAYRKTLLSPVTVPGRHGEQFAPWPMNWDYVWVTTIFSVFLLITGYAVFNRMKWRFVERP